MGILKAFDTIVHGGIQRPDSYYKKKSYQFGHTLGNMLLLLHCSKHNNPI